MDEISMEAQEIKEATKKADIAEIKLDEIFDGARNCRLRPRKLVDLT